MTAIQAGRTAAGVIFASVLTTWIPGELPAQAAAPFTVEWYPDTPMAGAATIITLHAVDQDAARAVEEIAGTFGGQELHFDLSDGLSFSALGGVPLDRSGQMEISLIVHTSDAAQVTLTAQLTAAAADYGTDTLTVPPRFTDALDSATASRVANERRMSRGVTDVAHSTARMWEGSFSLPRMARVTSRFGRTRVLNGEPRGRHTGTDLDGEEGDLVQAAAAGIVAIAQKFFYSGNVVFINHGAGLITTYSHLSQIEVSEGQSVRRGEVIGRVGATGRVTGPHLHWAARYGSIALNPLTLVDPKLTELLP